MSLNLNSLLFLFVSSCSHSLSLWLTVFSLDSIALTARFLKLNHFYRQRHHCRVKLPPQVQPMWIWGITATEMVSRRGKQALLSTWIYSYGPSLVFAIRVTIVVFLEAAFHLNQYNKTHTHSHFLTIVCCFVSMILCVCLCVCLVNE